MTWPGWGDILPSVTLVVGLAGSVAGLCWALVRLLVQPVAEKAASEAEKRSAEATRLAVDGARKDFGQRLDGGGNATGRAARPGARGPEGHGGAADGGRWLEHQFRLAGVPTGPHVVCRAARMHQTFVGTGRQIVQVKLP